MKNLAHNLRLCLTIAVLSLLLTACGGSGGSSSDGNTASRGTGTVGILLTDMPADPALFESINADIESISLIGDDDSSPVTIFSGPTETYDLLRLRNESVPVSFTDEIPAGQYCKIRLILSDLELVLADDTPDPDDNETHHPKLPGNGKLDLVVRDCFDVVEGQMLTLQLDIDAGNSIHIVGNNKGYQFRPVVFVDVLSEEFEPRLVRLEGEIVNIDVELEQFLICDAIPSQTDDYNGCVEVQLGDDSAFFDNETYSGDARALSELLTEENIGKTIAVVGLPQHWTEAPLKGKKVPPGHYPPAGECKLWEVGVPPGQQSAPIDCDDVPDILPDGILLVTHDGPQVDRHHPFMKVDGLAVELGEFLQVEGEVTTDADASSFTMTVSSGGPIITADALGVTLQGSTDAINGTRILSKTGEVLDSTAVVVPTPVEVDGTLELISGSDPLLKAALVVLDIEASENSEQVTGIVLSIEDDTLFIDPENDTVCGVTTDNLAVALAEDLEILTVTITDDLSEIETGGTLAVDQTVGMNGECDGSAYSTDNLVIVEDLR